MPTIAYRYVTMLLEERLAFPTVLARENELVESMKRSRRPSGRRGARRPSVWSESDSSVPSRHFAT